MDDLIDGLDDAARRKSKRPGWPVDPARLRRAVWRGRRWLIAAAIFGAVFGYVFAKFVMSSYYQTTAVLKYEGDIKFGASDHTERYALEPAANAIHGEAVLRRVREEWGRNWSLRDIAAEIEYGVDFRAGTLHISVFGDTPEETADFAHLVTRVFLDYHQERQARRIEEKISRIDHRIEGAQAEAEEARARYNEFREQHHISDLSTEQKSLVDSAAKLRADAELAIAEVRALEAQVASLEKQLATIPKTSAVGGQVSPERSAYSRLRQELASARATLSPDHPRVQALQQQVDQLRAQLRSGSGAGLVGSNATYRAVAEDLREAQSKLTTARERQKGLATMAERARVRVESFSGLEGEASALLAEVQVTEALIGKLHETEAALQDALEHTPSGFSVLDPGAIPEQPVPSTAKPLALIVIFMLSVLGTLGFLLTRELRGLRLQTPTEVAFWGNGPVLGATGWPDDAMGLDELVAGLDDFAPDARGSLLIIGGQPSEMPLAGELARRMNDDWFVDRPGDPQQTVHGVAPAGPTPIQTPPPSGPYPVGGGSRPSAAPARPSTALALQPVKLVRREQDLRLEAWDGPFEGQALRRAARLADRVIILVRSGTMTGFGVDAIARRIGRESGIGYIVVALPDELRGLPDRAGDVPRFWVT